MSYESSLKAYIEATNTHQFSKVELFLDEEATYFFSDQTCRGIPQIKAYFEHTWQLIKDEVYSVESVVWCGVSPTVATCYYLFKWSGYINGKAVSGQGRGTNVFVKKNEMWTITHEHLSSFQDN